MKSYVLKLTSAIVVDGDIVKAGSLVELAEHEAKNLLSRGKAVLATAADGVDVEEETTVDLSKLKKPQLVELAEKLGIEGAADLKVEELRAAIEAKEADAE